LNPGFALIHGQVATINILKIIAPAKLLEIQESFLIPHSSMFEGIRTGDTKSLPAGKKIDPIIVISVVGPNPL
jgi:hypothetical protein